MPLNGRLWPEGGTEGCPDGVAYAYCRWTCNATADEFVRQDIKEKTWKKTIAIRFSGWTFFRI
jgi:hypothetical protein